MVDSLSENERRSLILSVGTHRRERALSPNEVADLFHRAIERGASRRDCARLAGFADLSMVARFLMLRNLAASTRHMVGWGRSETTLSFSSAAELSRLPPDEQMEAFSLALEYQLTKSEIESIVQVRLRSGKSLRASVEEILNLRPRVERHYVFIGAITHTAVEQELAQLNESDRDRLVRSAVRTAIPGLEAGWFVRAGTDRFTIVASQEAAGRIGGDFEARVNEELLAEVRA